MKQFQWVSSRHVDGADPSLFVNSTISARRQRPTCLRRRQRPSGWRLSHKRLSGRPLRRISVNRSTSDAADRQPMSATDHSLLLFLNRQLPLHLCVRLLEGYVCFLVRPHPVVRIAIGSPVGSCIFDGLMPIFRQHLRSTLAMRSNIRRHQPRRLKLVASGQYSRPVFGLWGAPRRKQLLDDRAKLVFFRTHQQQGSYGE